MKISHIYIKDFHQFKDFSLDLTYPKGHKKEGQPLDKVCMIGQSGTGKTTLLELLPKFLVNYDTNLILKINEKMLLDNINIKVHIGINSEYFYIIKCITDPTGRVSIVRDVVKKDTDKIFARNTTSSNSHTSPKPIYFPANLNYDIELEAEKNIVDKPIIDFSKEKIANIWNLILEKIQSYQEQELQIRQDISRTVEQASNDLETIKKALKKLEDWKKTEFNPIQDVADNCLNALLAHFKLRVKTELDIKTKEDIGFIKVEDYAQNEIPHGLWSTGTKQVILSALPLYLLKPKHTVILFDEPERSLYPDLQRFIIDYYSSLANNCQFFYATHSPIIAASFEPWEIVELKFDEKGNIYRELYYEGENHIDNYKWNPKFMRWDDILQRVFDMENDGSPARKEKLDELATYNVKYKKLEKQGKKDSEEAIHLLRKIVDLSEKLSKWN